MTIEHLEHAKEALTPPAQKRTDKAIKIGENGQTVDRAQVKKNFGSTNPDFLLGLAEQIVNVASQGKDPDERKIAFVKSVINSIEPRDELEAMLATQMAAIHNTTLTFARRLAHVETIPQQDSAERALNKLARTFALQLQALQKYRSGGKQQVVVKHVHVNDGGQAIVGNVETGGR